MVHVSVIRSFEAIITTVVRITGNKHCKSSVEKFIYSRCNKSHHCDLTAVLKSCGSDYNITVLYSCILEKGM